MSKSDQSRKRVYYEGQPMTRKRRIQRRVTTKRAAIAATVREG